MSRMCDVNQSINLKNTIDIPLDSVIRARARQLKHMNLLTSSDQPLLMHNVKDVLNLCQKEEHILFLAYILEEHQELKLSKDKRERRF